MSHPTTSPGAGTSATPVSDELRASGYWNPEWDSFAELDPLWTEKFLDMAMHPMRKGLIEPKVWEFISIAVDASCTHMYGPGTRRHIRRALELGATPEEIAAVLQGVSVLGLHANSMGAPMLLEEVARHQARASPIRPS
ncbi:MULTISPECIES: carboxymuconolactone decarboxylase family protein [Hydrogenophaga]|jgi:alkylhydroperoxidase/carboxymuconolactone decarboxylase family protein YurZ|uniref:carboxymuconolactone decarboxylase family protein n=1 Tax=Hydrogenophaga TaxID=47420 RepID=UPI0008269D4A|nr:MULTISPECIES: carboxymuconolactone decarboxylase family protein [Hydrogenophaga]OPF64038.1 carboxymuconolactone decarboxylase [Hydrogenophaga sp. H7]